MMCAGAKLSGIFRREFEAIGRCYIVKTLFSKFKGDGARAQLDGILGSENIDHLFVTCCRQLRTYGT
jgi:hypothetical protein